MPDRTQVSGDPQIELLGVWKIFGADEKKLLQEMIAGGLSRQEILDRHRATVAVADVNLQIHDGETFCIMGLSGSGKSTLVRLMNRLIPATGGEIIVNGRNLGKMSDKDVRAFRSAHLAMVFQSAALLPHRTVIDNIVYPLELQHVPRETRMEKARQAIEIVQLGDWDDYFPDQLSGGMQQRVGLARALVADADILLMDEPFSALDPIIRRELQDEFLNIVKTFKKTAVFISHDLDEAVRLGDRIAVMKDGRILQIGTPVDIVMRPANEYVSRFVSGASPLHILTAADLMDPKHVPEDVPGTHHGDQGLVKDIDSLADLINTAVDSGLPMSIKGANGEIVGVVTEKSLLRGISESLTRKELSGFKGL